MKPLLAIDMGGTRVKAGIVADGKILEREIIPAHSFNGLGPRLPEIARLLKSLCSRREMEPRECGAIGISFPSLIDPASGRILAAYGKYGDAPGIDLNAWADREFGLKLAIDNDARMALLGEWKFGAAAGFENAVMITLGTGLGTAALIGGKILKGRHGQAGCLCGHFTVKYGGRPCSCGNIGCAEAEASTAFLRDIAATFPGFPESSLARVPVLDYQAVFSAAEQKDACALSLQNHSLQVWGSLAVNLIHAYDPEVVVLGGGLMQSGQVILPAITGYVQRHAHTPWGRVTVRSASLGDDAALLGCAAAIRETFAI